MKRYFYAASSIKLTKCVFPFPYDEMVNDEVFEGQWVSCLDTNLGVVLGVNEIVNY